MKPLTTDEFIQKSKQKYGDAFNYSKTNYCKQKGIKLIRIPYWDYNNIEKILNEGVNNEN